MTIIICPECGKEVSDQSEQCVHCGYPLHRNKITTNDTNENKSTTDDKYQLILIEYNENKVAIIKRIRDITGLDLSHAKSLVDSAPQTILTGLEYNQCKMYEGQFVSLGAKVDSIIDNEEIPQGSIDIRTISNKKASSTSSTWHCPACNKVISTSARQCPHCGHPLTKGAEKGSGVGFGGVVMAILVAFFIMCFL